MTKKEMKQQKIQMEMEMQIPLKKIRKILKAHGLKTKMEQIKMEEKIQTVMVNQIHG